MRVESVIAVRVMARPFFVFKDKNMALSIFFGMNLFYGTRLAFSYVVHRKFLGWIMKAIN